VDASHVSVRAQNGEVTLTGRVPGYPHYLAAATAAWRVAGVTNVRNDLLIVLPVGDERDDRTLAAMADNALSLDHGMPVDAAENGTVILTGTVRSGVERAAAGLLVAGLTGVRGIKNEIRIGDD
jgi:osmotically-inducible protein OsmY